MAFFFQGLRGATRSRLAVPIAAAAGFCEWHRSKCEAPGGDEELPALLQQAEEERKKQRQLKNPGAFERLIDEGKRLATADTFQGFRLEVNKMITPMFYLGHTMQLNPQLEMNNAKSIYDFYTQTTMPNGSMVMARYSHGGAIEGRYHLALGEIGVVKLLASLGPQPGKDSFAAETEVNGPDFCVTAKWMRGPSMHLSYMQAITPHLCIGGDSTFDAAEMAGVFGFGGKYTGKDWTAVFMAMHWGQVCFLQYVRRVVPGRVALVADLTVSPLQGQSQALLGVEVNMKQSRILTTVDQEGVISSSLECRVIPNAINLVLAAKIKQSEEKYEFGYGFNLTL